MTSSLFFHFRWIFFVFLLIPGYLLAQGNTKLRDAEFSFYEGEYEKSIEILSPLMDNPKGLTQQEKELGWYYMGASHVKLFHQKTQGLSEAVFASPSEAIRSFTELKQMATPDSPVPDSVREVLPLLGNLVNKEAIEAFTDKDFSRAEKGLLAIERISNLYDEPVPYVTYDMLGQTAMAKEDSIAALPWFRKSIEMYEEFPPAIPDPIQGYVYYRIALIEVYKNRDNQAGLKVLKDGEDFLKREEKRMKKAYPNAEGEKYRKLMQNFGLAKQNIEKFRLNILLNSPEDYKKALKEFQKSIEEEPNNYLYRIAYASLLELRSPDEAIRVYQEAIELDPDKFLAYFNLGAIYNNKAVFFHDEAGKETDPQKAEAYRQETEKYMKLAYDAFQEAHRVDPKDITVLKALKQISIFLELVDDYMMYKDKLDVLLGK